jgi:hypothetical protein
MKIVAKRCEANRYWHTFREDLFVTERTEVGPRVHGANHAVLPFRQAQGPELAEGLRVLCDSYLGFIEVRIFLAKNMYRIRPALKGLLSICNKYLFHAWRRVYCSVS